MEKKEKNISKKRILIVDDEEDILRLLSDFLTEKGFIVDTASDGKEALKQVASRKPDLITLDEVMPVMDGFEFLKALRSKKAYSAIPVIMLTFRSKDKDLETGISLGADFYLPKPFSFENLMDFIKLVLEK